MLDLISQLLDKNQGDEERVGFVLPGGEVIEVVNHSPTPADSFFVSDEDILQYGEIAIATWHTHTGGRTSLYSTDDHLMFAGYDKMVHYVIGSDGVQGYQSVDGAVMKVAV